MTRKEIIKALRCCNSDDGCRGCPLEMADLPQGTCVDKVLFDAADMLEQDAHFAGVGKMVYCKNCAHLEYEDLGIYYCGLHYITGQLSPEDYCSRGERKEKRHENH